MRTFEEILRDITRSCNNIFYNGSREMRPELVEAATKIYIAELYKDNKK